MRAGRMDKRIIIQQRTDTADDYNQPVAAWTTYKTVWAEVRNRPGREYFNNPETVAERMLMFRIRYVSGVTHKMRISYDGETYDIEAINPIGRNEGLEIIGRAQVD